MTSIIGVLSYGESANIYNAKKALQKVGANVLLVEKKEDLFKIDKLLLPGVGGFRASILHLNEISPILIDRIHEIPTLGICLGMQILSKIGYEFGVTSGLGLIDAEVKKIEGSCKVPHIGWDSLNIIGDSPLLEGILESDSFYFMHSYYIESCKEVIAYSNYCDKKYVSVFQKENVFGVQFHPEKSRDAGLKILKNFVVFE